VRHISQGDDSPPINNESFIILFNDSLCLCVDIRTWVNSPPLYVLHVERLVAESTTIIFIGLWCLKPPQRYKEQGEEEGESVLSIS